MSKVPTSYYQQFQTVQLNRCCLPFFLWEEADQVGTIKAIDLPEKKCNVLHLKSIENKVDNKCRILIGRLRWLTFLPFWLLLVSVEIEPKAGSALSFTDLS